jgi:RNA polymerase sigma-70 factor (ECF subfamily)
VGEHLAQLVSKAQKGDEEAFSTLVEQDWVRLVAFARSIVGDREAEDVVQDAFVIAWQKIDSLRQVEAYSAWMLRIVSRICFRKDRWARRFVPLAVVAERTEPSTSIRECAVDVERLLGALAPRQRAVMYLTVVDGLTDSEIGAVLSLEAASVRSHRRRARVRLQFLLSEKSTVEVSHGIAH